MRLNNIHEPDLEFGRNTHICPRAGIAEYDVYDSKLRARRDHILVGGVGTSDCLEKLHNWLERCSKYIPAKPNNKQPLLFLPFCGFNTESGFKAKLRIEDEIIRNLRNSTMREIRNISDWEERIDKAVEIYSEQVRFLAQNRNVDVIVCVIPNELYDEIANQKRQPIEEEIEDYSNADQIESNFRRALKAKTMHLGKPLQLARELSLEQNPKGQQDDATRAWNFCTALYYKANQTVPWRLVPDINRPSICFAGIGFYRSRDKKTLNTSLAQIFDELGHNVILRGTSVDIGKEDRMPHLSSEQAYELLLRALKEYEIALENSPARLVLHKSSIFNEAELDGFRQATDKMRINAVDFVTILDTKMRLFREGAYPPGRGTHLEFDRSNHILYTRGSVKHYKTYPGLYIPQPIEIRLIESDESPNIICKEILGLTKMNWNNTQFDGKYPITIQCARKVGEIMKYLDPQEDPEPQISYSYYM